MVYSAMLEYVDGVLKSGMSYKEVETPSRKTV
jgi:hypothetical protein